MEAPALPCGYQKTLQRAYPDCRIRWSARQECWLLERKSHYARLDINPENYPPEAHDTFIQRKDGMYQAGRYAPMGHHGLWGYPALPPAAVLVAILQANDTAKMDVAGATPEEQAHNYVTAMEEAEKEKLAKARADQSFYGSGAGGELHDQLAWAEGRRVSVPQSLPDK